MINVIVENLSKCYKLGKKKRIASDGLARLFDILAIGEEKKHLSREVWALKDISFSVSQGQVLGIIGRNGAGKSTLLKILARITSPTAGRAVIRGRVVSLLEIGTGFQPELSGRENIFLNAAFYGIKRDEVKRRFDDIVSFAELEKFIDTPVRHYSSGMYLRLAFSTAIHMNPDILLADEVLAVGDLSFQNRCMERMQEIGKSGVTILFVSHDMEAIERMCDWCIRIDEGKIVDYGVPQEIVRRYQEDALSLINKIRVNKSKKIKIKKGPHANEHGEIISVKLLSDKHQEIGAVKVSQDFFVKLSFRIFSSDVKVFCSFDVHCKNIHVFRTVAPQEIDVHIPGEYEVLIRIPKHLLAETVYSINAGVKITKDEYESYLVSYNAVTFQVYDTGETESARGAFTGRMPGVISPMLEWSFLKK